MGQTFEIRDFPAGLRTGRGRGKKPEYEAVRSALLALPAGKVVVVPLDFFPGTPFRASAESLLRMKKRVGHPVHMRRRPDGLYLRMEMGQKV